MVVANGTSERVLRSLVPEEQWPSQDSFWIDTGTHGKWVVDLENPSCIFMAVSRDELEPGCVCSDCMATLDKQTTRYGIPTTHWLRPRGILLENRGYIDPYSREAKTARGLAIALKLMTNPADVNKMCCG